MSQVSIVCPRCEEKFKAEKSQAYECPKCGTSIRPKNEMDHQDKTQVFKA